MMMTGPSLKWIQKLAFNISGLKFIHFSYEIWMCVLIIAINVRVLKFRPNVTLVANVISLLEGRDVET